MKGGIFDGDSGNLCVACKGSKMLCGKERCPILVKHFAQLRARALIDTLELEGSSPPGVFVGQWGYPKVLVGPLIPPISGDTGVMDTPEMWLGKSIDEIVDFRVRLVRGMHPVNIYDVERGGRLVDLVRELALASSPADSWAEFLKKPVGRLILDDEVQPFGPSAPLKRLEVGNFRLDQRFEKRWRDTDLTAREAVLSLYSEGALISRIQKAFSVGSFGLRKNRRFVPTRWSITAVDDTIGKELRERVKRLPLINDYRIHESWTLDNRFIVLLMPTSWRYELVEAWYPNTVWNPLGREIMMISSHEGYEGRKDYAEIGGCYYAARLATCEHLLHLGRQAGCVILREAHPGYIMPVGVWNVRENVRNALRGPFVSFRTLGEALEHIQTRLDIRMKRWLRASRILADLRHQRRIDEFLPVEPAARNQEGVG
ncbi:MAG: Nre family DNA repair protein [Thermoplasmata archaeon]